MGASRRTHSPAPSSVAARDYFYSGMTDLSLQPMDFAAGLAQVAPLAHIERHGPSGVIHAEVSLTPADGQGYFRLTRIGRELTVIVENYSLSKPRIDRIRDGGLIELDFRLSGDVTRAPTQSRAVHINRPGLFVTAHPQDSVSTRLTASSSTERGITLVVTPQFLEHEFLTPCGLRHSPLRELTASPITRGQSYRTPLSAVMFEIVTQFLASRYTGTLSHKYTEGVALELLCAAVSELSLVTAGRRSSGVSAHGTHGSRPSLDSWLLHLPTGNTRH
jgi:hypothetical protein